MPVPNDDRPRLSLARPSDEQIAAEIGRRLMAHAALHGLDVEVEVSAGEVRIVGLVEQRPTKHAIEDVIALCPGVGDIVNAIRVRPGFERRSSATIERGG